MDVLVDAGIPVGPVYEVEDALNNPQIREREAISEIQRGETTIPVIEHPLHFENADSGFETPPPELGEHTREILLENGYDGDRIDAMADQGAFGIKE